MATFYDQPEDYEAIHFLAFTIYAQDNAKDGKYAVRWVLLDPVLKERYFEIAIRSVERWKIGEQDSQNKLEERVSEMNKRTYDVKITNAWHP